jgi:signal transduction histidine kinase
LASEVARVKEWEQQHIAQGLHDDVGQTLATLKLKLGNPKEFPPDVISADFRKDVINLLDQAIQATRTLTFELGLPILYQLGLLAALQSLGEQFQTRHPEIRVQVEVTKQPLYLANEMAIVLFRAIRELLMNIEKHAQSRHVSIAVEKDKGYLYIIVEDDGRGFSPTQATQELPFTGNRAAPRGGAVPHSNCRPARPLLT